MALDKSNLQDFKMLIEKNYIYVDKTALIYEIAQEPTAFIINSERRTGKTLLLSTIKTIFEQKFEWWQQYGANLKIMQLNPNFFDANPHPIIEFDFSQSQNNDSFIDRIREALNTTITNYHLPLKPIEKAITLQKLIDVEFADILNHLRGMQSNKVVITIDECDQPLLNQMFDENLTKELQEQRMTATIKSFNMFYGYLKYQLGSKGFVRLVVVAGHSMIAKSSIYSGILCICLLIKLCSFSLQQSCYFALFS